MKKKNHRESLEKSKKFNKNSRRGRKMTQSEGKGKGVALGGGKAFSKGPTSNTSWRKGND